MKLIPLYFTLILFCLGYLQTSAQVVNYCLKLDGTDYIQCENLEEIEQAQEYTFQFLISPEKWTPSAYIFKSGAAGKGYSLQLSDREGELIFRAGRKKVVINGIKVSNWTQLTLMSVGEGLSVWINGVLTQTFSGKYILPKTSEGLRIGENFSGRIDEFRIWSSSLDFSNLDNLMLQNSLNKFHTDWDKLVLYYKFDQDLSKHNVIDYKYKYHGTPSKLIVREQVLDNNYFRYRIVSGYSSFTRHCDRLNIDRQMHLMTNDLIMLDGLVDGYTGEICMGSADNGVLTGDYSYIESFKGRAGVFKLNGNASMNIGKNALAYDDRMKGSFSFSGWFCIEDWKDGAYLLKRQETPDKRVNVRLSDSKSRELIVEVNNLDFSFKNALKGGDVWQHIAVTVDTKAKKDGVRLYVDNKLFLPENNNAEHLEVPDIDAELFIGEGFSGVIDDIVIRKIAKRDFSQEISSLNDDLKFPRGGAAAMYVDGYWTFDKEDNLGHNNLSWQSKLDQIRELYSGHRGYKIRIGLISHHKNSDGVKVWTDSISSNLWRETLASEVARIIPYCDGIDVDFEWLNNNPDNIKWVSYGEMVKALRKVIPDEKILSVSLHPVSYTLPTTDEVLGAIDYITFQNYGPRPTYLYYDAYAKFYDDALEYGIPAEKILLSMATLIVRKDNTGVNVSGYKNLDFSNITDRSNDAIFKGQDYTFNGVDMVKKKMKLLVDKNSGGCMYFDMGNDLNVHDKFSLIRALNSVISSNVDSLVVNVYPQ